MGPMPPPDTFVEEVTQEVLDFLRENRKLLVDEHSVLSRNGSRDKVIAKLKEAIGEVIYQEYCESF
jgi:hypothetical protein